MNDPWVIEKRLVERKLDLVLHLIYEIKGFLFIIFEAEKLPAITS